jgi:hypothetical protein
LLCFSLVNCEPEGGRKRCANTINGQTAFQFFIEWIGKAVPDFNLLGDAEARRANGRQQEALGKPVRLLRLFGGVSTTFRARNIPHGRTGKALRARYHAPG